MLRTKGRIVFFVIAAGVLLRGPGPVAAGSPHERVKALYLYNFLLFVDWPEQALGQGDVIRVGVTGDDPLFLTLTKMRKYAI
jgi:hypothetical protein